MGRKAPPPTSSAAEPALVSPPLLVPKQEEEDVRPTPHVARYDAGFDESRVDPDAQKVVRRLTGHGFQAYLVGGCVRDLLLGRGKVIEVATFRRSPTVDSDPLDGGNGGGDVDLLIRSDNAFGEAHEDA